MHNHDICIYEFIYIYTYIYIHIIALYTCVDPLTHSYGVYSWVIIPASLAGCHQKSMAGTGFSMDWLWLVRLLRLGIDEIN